MSFFSQPEIYSVSQITNQIKSLLEDEYRFVHISGEVSNLRKPHSGHLYFTLKDDSAQLRAVLFKGQQKFLSEPIDDGVQLICHGRISVYEPRGEYQIIVDTVDFHGQGVLYAKFEQLKKKLQDEGLFDQQIKKPIPPFPKTVAVITSPTGAAIRDFLTIHQQRQSNCHISIFPVRVQGEGSSKEISKAIYQINESLSVDVIVLIRGGGSIEDLWSFNEENVARAIGDSIIPVVTGIGHETDYTIADFCGDLRVPTPTAAAEQLFVDQAEILAYSHSLIRRMVLALSAKVDTGVSSVRAYTKRISNFEPIFTRYSLDLDYRFTRLVDLMNRRLFVEQSRLNQLLLTLKHLAPDSQIQADMKKIDLLATRLDASTKLVLQKKENRFEQLLTLLDAVSPLATLARGYSITGKKDPTTEEFTVISSSEQVQLRDTLQIILQHGQIDCDVVDISKPDFKEEE